MVEGHFRPWEASIYCPLASEARTRSHSHFYTTKGGVFQGYTPDTIKRTKVATWQMDKGPSFAKELFITYAK